MPGQLKFGIVGCGRIAGRHAIQAGNKGKLVAVCDIVKEKADAMAGAYQARPYSTIEDLLKHETSIDVIAICTPNGLHAQHCIQSLRAGFHVLCEKPMALQVQDCHEMISAAVKASRQLVIVKQNRFNPPVAAVKKLIEDGRLGKIYSFQLSCFWNRGADYYNNSWKGTLQLDGGTLYTQFSHFIDLLYWMMGDVKQVQAMLKNYAHKGVIEFEDTGAVLLEFANGVSGTFNYTVNSYGKNMEGSLTVFGEKGTVKVGGQYLNELEYQSIEGYTIGQLPAGNKANHYGNYEGSMSNHDKVYDNLADVLQKNAAASVSAMEGLKTVEIIEKIYRAGRHL